MGTPLGDPPTEETVIDWVESHFEPYRYGPVEHVDTGMGGLLVFHSKSYPVQFDLRPKGDWGEELEAVEYHVYDRRISELVSDPSKFGGDLLNRENTAHMTGLGSDLTWERSFEKLLMSVSGCINGAIHRGTLEADGG